VLVARFARIPYDRIGGVPARAYNEVLAYMHAKVGADRDRRHDLEAAKREAEAG
jgi:hypothetical protein